MLDRLPKKQQVEGKGRLQQIAYADSQAQAEEKRDRFVQWCQREGYREAAQTLMRDWERMGHLLPVPQGTLEASAHHQSGRVSFCRAAAADGCGQAVQEGG